MSKRKKDLSRLDKLFIDTEPIPPNPGKETRGRSSYESPPIPDYTLVETPQPEIEKPSSWDDYLNAIDRNERIGFCFDQENVTSLAKPLSIITNTTVVKSGEGAKSTSVLATPLRVGDQVIGSIQLEKEAISSWSDQEARVVVSIARQITQHLENLRLLTQADHYRKEADKALNKLTHEEWQNYLDQSSADNIPSSFVYDSGQVVQVAPVNLDEPSKIEKLSQPIKIRDELIGNLIASDISQEDNALVASVAERLSIHLETLRLYEETEHARQQLNKYTNELEMVANVSTAAATILDPHVLLQTVVNLTKERFGLYQTNIYVLENDMLILKAASGEEGLKLLAEKYVLWINQSPSIVTKVARTRSGVIVTDTFSDPDYLSNPLLPETRSELAVPLTVGDRLLGVFDIQSETPARFSDSDMRTFSTLAAQIAVALQNAELYAEQIATVNRLKELDHLKSAFLANMSHELRTPLNSILGFTQVIQEELDGPLTGEMVADLKLIEKNSHHLLKLINDVLDLAKIEAGRMSLNLDTFNLVELLNDILETTSPLAREKSLEVNLQVEPKDVLLITADMVRLHQILLNLVGNAMKFTESGEITITAKRTDSKIIIQIQDTGIGIPSDQLEAIFEAFTQIDTSTTRKASGTGLGLPISRRLVEMHGGRLWAESSGIPGEGSTFCIELPMKPHPDQEMTRV